MSLGSKGDDSWELVGSCWGIGVVNVYMNLSISLVSSCFLVHYLFRTFISCSYYEFNGFGSIFSVQERLHPLQCRFGCYCTATKAVALHFV